MVGKHPTRRRAIAIFAATTAGVLLDGISKQARGAYEWRGIAMGADARIVFGDMEEDRARAAVDRIVSEIERLELALSLFRQDSEICRLNRDGILEQPSLDLRAALTLALTMSAATGGLFDPTVQALWEAHTDWFAKNPERGPPPEQIVAVARSRVGWQRITIAPAAIRLGKNQRVTLNGLGQGYVTDRIAQLLHLNGLAHVLIDLGEQRALGPQNDGSAWIIARIGADPIALHDGALATSEGTGCTFGAGGDVHHLFDPRSGRSASIWQRVTVHHQSAAVADALSTGLYAATKQEVEQILDRFPGAAIFASARGNREIRWPSRLASGHRPPLAQMRPI